MSVFENFKSEKPPVTGTSVINHAVRLKLKLNCSEYVYLSYLASCVKKSIVIDPMEVYKETGMDVNEQNVLTKTFIANAFVFIEKDGSLTLTSKWFDAWPNHEKEFEEFWFKDKKAIWTGSKKKALEFYIKVRKQISKDKLIEQRNKYLEFIAATRKTGFNRDVMMAERWLNPKNEYYLEDYQSYIDQLKTRYSWLFVTPGETPQAASLTKDDYTKAYEQDTNQQGNINSDNTTDSKVE